MRTFPVVVADDDAAMLRLLEAHLTRAGFKTFTCADGDEALILVRRHKPVILLADWHMPGLTGPELCRKIRESELGDDVYAILITGNSRPEEIAAGLDVGGNDYLVKPVPPTILLARVRAGERVLELLGRQREYVRDLESEIAKRKLAENAADERATELERQAIELEKSRRVAMGIMEDAELARRGAEAAREELRGAKDYTDNIIRSMIDMLLVVAPDGTIRTANEATYSVLGYAEGELIGRPTSLLFSEEEEEEDEEEDSTQLIISQEALPFKRHVLRRLVKDGAISNFEITLRVKSGDSIPVLMSGSVMRDGNGQIKGIVCVAQDIRARKRAELELKDYTLSLEGANAALNQALEEAESSRERAESAIDEQERLHRELIEVSRQAGMAEIATGVLHNVGNVLNSVNVSASLVAEKVRRSKISDLARAAELMARHTDDLESFIAKDEKGRHFSAYLTMLAEHLAKEQAETIEELGSLTENVEHIKAIVSMQQSYAGMSGLVERVDVTEVLEEVLKMSAASSERHGIAVAREYHEIPPIMVDKHKLLQILVNLVRNAADALVESGAHKKRLTVRMAMSPDNRLRIEVTDNGIGIDRNDLARIFAHGYTTKKDGHGFGLHGAALMAKEMGGSLTAHSDGPAKGATFTLELLLDASKVNA